MNEIEILGIGNLPDWTKNHIYYRLDDTKIDVLLVNLLEDYHQVLTLNKALMLRVSKLASQIETQNINAIDDQEYFFKFQQKMFLEYLMHCDESGDSWKDCSELDILQYLKRAVEEHDLISLEENPEHFVDIANFALFCYFIFKHETEIGEIR